MKASVEDGMTDHTGFTGVDDGGETITIFTNV